MFFKTFARTNFCVSMKARLPEGSLSPAFEGMGVYRWWSPSFRTEGPDFKYLHHNKSLENKEFLSMEIRCFGGSIKSQDSVRPDFLDQTDGRVACLASLSGKNRPTTAEPQAHAGECWAEGHETTGDHPWE